MDLSKVLVVDIECDGLLDTLTKVHVMSVGYQNGEGGWEIMSTPDYDNMRKVMEDEDNIIVGHYFTVFDVPAIEKVLGIKVECQIIDTLALSWYLSPKRMNHGLEGFGEDFGVPKPVIDNWENLSYEEYKHRCEEDVKINTNLWLTQLGKLSMLYDNDEDIYNTIRYLMHKMNCIRQQEENPLTIDVEQCKKNLELLEKVIEEKVEELKAIMPKVMKTATRNRPKSLFKKDGSLSVAGEKWFNLIEVSGLPEDYDGQIKEVIKYEDPNPQSATQMKEYLFSLGWKPKIYKDGANGKVAQLRDDNKNLCESILKLAESHPELNALDGLSVAQHRAGILKGFLKELKDEDKIVAGVSKFARTLRMAHRTVVNLPKPSAQYGELIRSVIIAPEGKILCGSDVSSLENKTLQNAIYHLDKEYVEEMNFPGFDAHLKLGKMAGLITEQDAEFFLWYKKYDSLYRDGKLEDLGDWVKEGMSSSLIVDLVGLPTDQMHELFEEITKKRHVSKTSNYALTYNCAPPTLAASAKISLGEAEKIHKAYWDMNWAVKDYTDSLETKEIDGETWIYNPASRLWLYLASDHIKFSACNQNAGVKIFDLWVYFCMQKGVKVSYQAHDEILFTIDEGDKDEVRNKLKESMREVNEALQLPVPIEVDVQFGKNYAEVH